MNLKSQISGIQLATKIRSNDQQAKIVFITSDPEMMLVTFQYQIEAMDFIVKDFSEPFQRCAIKIIQNCFRKFNEEERNSIDYLQISNHDQARSVRVSDILFFETSIVPHKVIAHLIDGEMEFYSAIKNLSSKRKVFYRCHKSYVVNCANIRSIDKHRRLITMINGETILCSAVACRFLLRKTKLILSC